SKGPTVPAASLSISKSNARPGSVFTGPQPAPLQRWQYDLRPLASNGRPDCRTRARFGEPAGISKAGVDAKLVETLSTFERRRSCPFNNRARLVVLAARHHGNGRVRGLSQTAADHPPDRLCPGIALRGRISGRSGPWHSLFARRRTASGS